MPKHVNSASRLISVISTAARSNAQHAYQAWAEALGVPQDQNHFTALGVFERLLWVQSEIDAVRAGMKIRNYSESLYEPAISRVQKALQPLQLGVAWQGNGASQITGEVLNALGFCAEILPDEEAELSQDDLASIRALITEIEALLETSTLPQVLRILLGHHLDLIHTALARYPVNGISALRDAAWTATGEMLYLKKHKLADGEEDFSARPEVQKLESMWDTVNTTVDGAAKVASVYELGSTLYKAAQALLNGPS
ncbi:MAG: hypothetical protein Q7T55_03960 [Solirubrobacteraceae bacterium]|nr:hypothetical protein [Solirubrobacteraceae bacterium]